MPVKHNIFSRAKAYVKQHPRTSYQEAIQIVAKGKHKVGATSKRKVTGKRKTVAPVVLVSGTRPRKRKAVLVHSTRPGTRIDKAKKILKDIEKLERERSQINNRELKDIYALEINAHHRKLKGLHR